jgi:hypothetical protein
MGVNRNSDNSFVQGTRIPLLRGKLLAEGGIKVIGKLGVNLSGRGSMAGQGVFRKRFDDWEAIL